MRQSSNTKSARWATVAIAAVALVVGSGAAHAARFVAKFDPVFNLEFDAEVGEKVAFRGEATITVDDSCLIPNSIQRVGGWSSCESATLDSGTLTFYSYALVPGFDPITLTWTDGPPEIIKLKVDGAGNVDGIDTRPAVKFSDINLFDELWDIKLDFTLNFPTLTLTEVACDRDDDDKYKHKCKPEVFRSGQDGVPNPTTVWTRVPEPGSLALVGLALAAVGLTGRRKRIG